MKPARLQFDRRSSGILLHPTSLPGLHGSGDLGLESRKFAEFLARSSQRWWQMLPVCPPSDAPSFSPYDSSSAFAGSPWLINLEDLAKEKLLSRSDLIGPKFDSRKADWPKVVKFRAAMLRKAFANFQRRSADRLAFESFCQKNRTWLDDYALFAAIKSEQRGRGWMHWPRELRLRDPKALAAATKRLANEIAFHRFVQFQFDKQWTLLKNYCRKIGVGLLGDLPIFVAYDSADVWTHRELFRLDKQGRPISVSGCPPDVFSPDGQMWGHPQYDWAEHRRTHFAWWVERVRALLEKFDGVRIDHFLGFNRTWCIPYGAKNGRRGKWVMSPGLELFQTVRKKLGRAPIIAEDLGLLTPAAEKLRDRLEFPGMRVIEFAWGEGGHYHRPHNCPPRSVVYTGTHDNDTIVGWFESADRSDRARALAYVGGKANEIHDSMIRAALASPAETVILPVQDLLGLNRDSRMNIPATIKNNWRWRMKTGELKSSHGNHLRDLTKLTGRS